jgi:uncharacterized protein
MIIKVKVKPNSSTNSIHKISDSEFVAEIKEPPEKGKANAKLINLLSKEFKVNVKSIKIKNPTSKKKIVEIR